ALKGNIKGKPLGDRPPPQRGMVHRPGLGGEVLNGVYPLDRPPAIVKHREVTLDPGERGKFCVWGTPRHQDEVVLLPQHADDKRTQLAAGTCDEHFHRISPVLCSASPSACEGWARAQRPAGPSTHPPCCPEASGRRPGYCPSPGLSHPVQPL